MVQGDGKPACPPRPVREFLRDKVRQSNRPRNTQETHTIQGFLKSLGHQYPEPKVTDTPCPGSPFPRGIGHRSPEGGTLRFSNMPSTASARASSRVRRSESAAS